MAAKLKVEYIRYQTDGSGALQPQYEQHKSRTSLPRRRRKKVRVITVDPTALVALAVAAVMLVLMLGAVGQLQQAQRERDAMAEYVQQLQEKREQLQVTYTQTVDLQEVEKRALALGMVRADSVEHITIHVPQVSVQVPVEQEITLLEKIRDFFDGIFA